MKLRLHLKFCTNPPSVFPEDNKMIRPKMEEKEFCKLININKIYSYFSLCTDYFSLCTGRFGVYVGIFQKIRNIFRKVK